MTKTISAALAVVLALTIGCGGDDEPAAPASTTTTERSTTTAAPTPDEAFAADIERQLDFGGVDGTAASLDLAQRICDVLTTMAGTATDDAANDTPQTDASVMAVGYSLAIDAAFTGDTPDDAVAVILRTGGEHLCAEHADTIEADLTARGL
jgi:hypothetical protein